MKNPASAIAEPQNRTLAYPLGSHFMSPYYFRFALHHITIKHEMFEERPPKPASGCSHANTAGGDHRRQSLESLSCSGGRQLSPWLLSQLRRRLCLQEGDRCGAVEKWTTWQPRCPGDTRDSKATMVSMEKNQAGRDLLRWYNHGLVAELCTHLS